MRVLKMVLIWKITITGLFWCAPLLLFPASWFVALGMPAPEPMMFVRLLGATYFALLVGYYMVLKGLERGENPKAVVYMGIASNGLAGLILLLYGLAGTWSSWGLLAQCIMWLSVLGAAVVTVNLLRFRRLSA